MTGLSDNHKVIILLISFNFSFSKYVEKHCTTPFRLPVADSAYFWSIVKAYWRSWHSKQRWLKHGKSFHRSGGDLSRIFCIHAPISQCITNLQPEIQYLTLHRARLIWKVWPGRLGVSVSAWQWHRRIESVEKHTIRIQSCLASMPFAQISMVTWPHFVTVYSFSAV